MTTTEKANIGGYAFTLEKDAFEKLEKYLAAIEKAYKADPFSKEIVSDIEVRIAELLQEKCGKDSIVNVSDIQTVCDRIGSPKDLEIEGHETVEEVKEDTLPKRLYRDIDNKILGGVCSGIAARLDTDVVFIRIAFALLFCFGFISGGSMFGIMTLVYIALWIIISPAKSVEDKCRMRGKPIELEQFKGSVKDFGKEVSSSPALHTFGRIVSIFIGIIMMTIGLCGLFGATVLPIMPHFAERFLAEIGTIDPITDEITYFATGLFAENITWWLLTAVAGLFSILMLYGGVLLTFHFKEPKWKPGIIIFILWILSILFFAGFIINRLAVFSLTV